MPTSDLQKTQVIVCGSGCAGSLLAWILAKRGIDVCLIDRGQHPRFAIGESSTPLADFLLEKMADEFGLPELRPLARWGSWTREYPQLRAGKKRGFTYYGHQTHQAFSDDAEHSRSLLVAASASDELSDTHWMRADVDHWLCQQAIANGAELLENTHIQSLEREPDGWLVTAEQAGCIFRYRTDWLIDATGTGGIVPRAMGVTRIDDQLLTQTGSLFGHFTDIGSMPQWLTDHQLPCSEDPFNSDDAAQHHVLEDGWVWMLRFDCGITSMGITRPTSLWQDEGVVNRNLNQAWQQQLDQYPTLADLMHRAHLVGPVQPGRDIAELGWMPRLSRLWSAAAGKGWLALPSTVGVIDPLHSTGIAHALSGVLRAAQILTGKPHSSSTHAALAAYRVDVVSEVRWIDRLVSTCYAGLPSYELFAAACSFYFIAAHTCEEELRDTGELRHGFLGFKRAAWQEMVQVTASEFGGFQHQVSPRQFQQFHQRLRQRIEPWNRIGLLDPQFRNRYSRSATKLEPTSSAVAAPH